MSWSLVRCQASVLSLCFDCFVSPCANPAFSPTSHMASHAPMYFYSIFLLKMLVKIWLGSCRLFFSLAHAFYACLILAQRTLICCIIFLFERGSTRPLIRTIPCSRSSYAFLFFVHFAFFFLMLFHDVLSWFWLNVPHPYAPPCTFSFLHSFVIPFWACLGTPQARCVMHLPNYRPRVK